VLDLLDYDDMRRFQEYRTRVIRELRKRRKRVWKQRPWDGYVINMLCIHGGIRVVRAAFPEPEEHVDDTVRRNESRIVSVNQKGDHCAHRKGIHPEHRARPLPPAPSRQCE